MLIKNFFVLLVSLYFISKTADVVRDFSVKAKIVLECEDDNCDQKTKADNEEDSKIAVTGHSDLQNSLPVAKLKQLFHYQAKFLARLRVKLNFPPPEF
jgi:hypothetical protein